VTTSTKQLLRELDTLDESTLKRIPDLNDPQGPGREIHASAARVEEMKRERNHIRGELSKTGPGDLAGSRSMLSEQQIAADADLLLAGGGLDEIIETTAVDHRQSLVRRLHACERALPILEARMTETQNRVIREGLAELEPLGAELYSEVLDAFANLREHLEGWAQFTDLLGRRGFSLHLRESRWQLSEFEKALLFGGVFPSIEHHTNLRKQSWPGLVEGGPQK
jgi:hypothetical protein